MRGADMLISLKINNCFIYNCEVEFTMRADMRYKRFPSNVVSEKNTHILKAAMLIGPNNAGKTNFVRCLRAVKSIMLNKPYSLKSNLFVDNPICELSVCFLADKEYIFEVRCNSETGEFIYERFAEVTYDKHKNRKETDLLVRDAVQKVYQCDDEQLKTVMPATAKNNILIYLLDASQFPVLDKIKKAIVSFASKIDILDMNNIPIKKTIDMLKLPGPTQQKIVNFIRNADLSLEDYRYAGDDELKIEVKSGSGADMAPQENSLKESAPLVEMLHLTSVYNGVSVHSILFDSTGTKKMAAIASYVIDALEQGRILVVDELDNSLHFKLTRGIISLFNNELNQTAQLICTVHDITLLDCQRLFRKEQIWFAHKDEDSAYLYSLSDFTSERDRVRDTSDLIEKYKSGVFGALPEPDLFQSLLEVREDG